MEIKEILHDFTIALGDAYIDFSKKVLYNREYQKMGAELMHNIGQALIVELENKEKK